MNVLLFLLLLLPVNRPWRGYEVTYTITYTFPATAEMGEVQIVYPNFRLPEENLRKARRGA